MDNKRLEQVNKYWDNFNKGNYEECSSIIRVYMRTTNFVTGIMFWKALEVKAYDLCELIIWRIDKTSITEDMFCEIASHGKEAIRLCGILLLFINKSLITDRMLDFFLYNVVLKKNDS